MLVDAMNDALEESGLIADNLPCRSCGYNLRGLALHGHCPECHAANRLALDGDLLRNSDPRWVRSLARGFRLLSVAVVFGLVAIIFAAAARQSLGLPWLVLAIVLTVGAISLLGVWLITEREPAAEEGERLFSDRRMLRVSTVLGVGLQASSGFIVLHLPRTALPLRTLAAGVMVVGILFAFRHAIRLAERIPDRPLASETRAVMWGLMWSYGAFLGLVALALGNAAVPEFFMLAFSLSCTVIIACVIFSLWCLTLFSRYASAIGLEASASAARRSGAPDVVPAVLP